MFSQKELSYDFEILHVILSYLKNKIETFNKFLTIVFSQNRYSYGSETFLVILSYQKNKISTFKHF